MLDNETSRVAPLLVQLYDSHKLYALARDSSDPARRELSGIILDLFQSDLSAREAELISDVLINLMRQIEIDLRAAMAEKLARLDNIPLRVILFLAADEINVAEHVLLHSPVLNDLDLLYIIQSQGPEYWRAIAQRQKLASQVVSVLAETRDLVTLKNLAGNDNISLTEKAYGVIGEFAESHADLAEITVRREDVPSELAVRLYRIVGHEIKSRITTRFPQVKASVEKSYREAVIDMVESAEAPRDAFLPDESQINAAFAARDAGTLGLPSMLETLRAGNIRSFIAQCAVYTGLACQTVAEILRQENGQGLAVLCRARDINKSDFLTIFLLTGRIRKAEKIVSKTTMTRALGYYDRISKPLAERIMRNSQQSVGSF